MADNLQDYSDNDFTLAFESLTVSDILDGKRIAWSDKTKTLVLKHGITYRYSSKSLPDTNTLIHLANIIQVPKHLGKEVYRGCLTKTVTLIQNLLSEAKLRPALIEVAANSDARTRTKTYLCTWACCTTAMLNDNEFSYASITIPNWLEERFVASDRLQYEPIVGSGVSPKSLVNAAVHTMVQTKSLYKRDLRITIDEPVVPTLTLPARRFGVPGPAPAHDHAHGAPTPATVATTAPAAPGSGAPALALTPTPAFNFPAPASTPAHGAPTPATVAATAPARSGSVAPAPAPTPSPTPAFNFLAPAPAHGAPTPATIAAAAPAAPGSGAPAPALTPTSASNPPVPAPSTAARRNEAAFVTFYAILFHIMKQSYHNGTLALPEDVRTFFKLPRKTDNLNSTSIAYNPSEDYVRKVAQAYYLANFHLPKNLAFDLTDKYGF